MKPEDPDSYAKGIREGKIAAFRLLFVILAMIAFLGGAAFMVRFFQVSVVLKDMGVSYSDMLDYHPDLLADALFGTIGFGLVIAFSVTAFAVGRLKG
ncbi:MAG TPA: hypothetical protein DEA96_12865 [Leptospiraceae bacterium]|nr:hypothetical protein [Spirochaetaceae bacterium]HBS05854.1 hypothetical protein [Leptospiraceae bacterium]|tara:strand:+ start:487 stop:777 length:291 start_codon:yes stop_codon:yes gene_type:complete